MKRNKINFLKKYVGDGVGDGVGQSAGAKATTPPDEHAWDFSWHWPPQNRL